MSELIVKEKTEHDFALFKTIMDRDWGGEPLIIHGKKYFPTALPGIILYEGSQIKGFLSYEIRASVCEIIALETYEKFKGLGTLLLEKLKIIAKKNQCNSMYVMTTNDNLDALRFYQRRGFKLCGIHLNSTQSARIVKPSIPETGDYNIPIRDELDLELLIQ